ncbi:hypothetical protein GGF46_005375 [Coemansia sp. RSA 552]|nr:hypothetical protein GGF46_005375 [Coemansia sp. RSA 552]
MKLEEKLARWVEHPDDDDDADYGLIIDDSITEGPPRAAPFPPQFTKAGSCSHIPGRPALLSPGALLTTTNIRPVPRPAMLQPPVARPSMSAQDVLQRYVEPADEENYDDLVLPEDEELLDRQLAQMKTPCRRLPSWPNDLGEDVPMSGATAVEAESHPTKAPRTAARAAATGAAADLEGTPTIGSIAAKRHALSAIVAATQPTPPPSQPTPGPVCAAAPRSPLYLARSPLQPLQPPRPQQSRPRRPVLIKNTRPAVEPLVLGSMRYDPAAQVWVGNEDEGSRIASAIAESERQQQQQQQQQRSRGGTARSARLIDASKLALKISRRSGNPDDDMVIVESPERDTHPEPRDCRPAWHASAAANHRRRLSPTNPLTQASIESAKGRPTLIPPSAASLVAPPPGSASPDGRAPPVFDPQNLRWIDPNEDPLDPLWNIADLPVEPSPIDAMHYTGRLRSASEAIGGDNTKNCFVLSEEQIATYHRESIDYGAFAQHWFPKPST